MLKVKGNEGLYRDTESGAIVSEKSPEFEAYRRRKNIFKEQKKELSELKTIIAEVKEQLKALKDRN